MKIAVFGAGYVGLTTSGCLTSLGHEVMCVDVDVQRVNNILSGKLPFYEPGLDKLIGKGLSRKILSFTTSGKDAVTFGEVIFNCVGTPSDDNGAADLSAFFSVTKEIAKNIMSYKVIVNKSTVPPGTAQKTSKIIGNVFQDSDVVSNPEFLREGAAVYDFTHPDKIVLGCRSEKALKIMRDVYSGRMRTYLPIVECSWETAELIKYANNSFLATKISFINEMANICDRFGADIKMLSLALGLDYRISPKFLNPGVGFGGSCLPKDLRAIIQASKSAGYEPRLLEEVSLLNERQKSAIISKIEEAFGNVHGKKFCILGLSFKPNTSDMREAPSISIINSLLGKGAVIHAYDPEAMKEAKRTFGSKVDLFDSVEEAAKGCDGLVVVTEWDEFRNLDLGELRKSMADGKLFDGRNIYEPEIAREDGFEYFGVGRR